jgi:hypothetical protein
LYISNVLNPLQIFKVLDEHVFKANKLLSSTIVKVGSSRIDLDDEDVGKMGRENSLKYKTNTQIDEFLYQNPSPQPVLGDITNQDDEDGKDREMPMDLADETMDGQEGHVRVS